MTRTMRVAGLLVAAVATGLAAGVARSEAGRLAEVGTSPLVTVEGRSFTSAKGVEVEAEIGRLAVPELRSERGGKTIELAFVRLRSTSQAPAAPLVYLAGGPGQSSTWMAEEPRALDEWIPALAVGDVILLDQRGTGKSAPTLGWRLDGLPPLDVFTSEQAAMRHALDVARRARAALLERGIDLRGYTTVESAEDIEALRQALGLDKISIYGFSYGTHLALAYIRRHGDRVENAILAGVEGPEHTLKLPWTMDTQMRRISWLVARDPVVGPRVPDMMALLARVLDKLAAEPMVIPIGAPGGKGTVDVPVGPFGLEMILRFDVGDASDLPVFPRLLHSIDQGDPRVLKWFLEKRAGIVLGTNGMSAMMDCASGASLPRRELIREQAATSLFGGVVNFPFPEICAAWEAPDLGPSFRAPLATGVRTLFLSGTFDWNSPPHQATEVRWGFSNSTHLVVENAGHEQIVTHPAIRDAWVRFLRGDDVSDVRAAWPPLRFVPLAGHDPEVTHPSVPRS